MRNEFIINIFLSCLLGLVILGGCGPEVKEGEVPNKLEIEFKEVTLTKGPVTRPVKRHSKILVQAHLVRPFSEKYQLKEKHWEWKINNHLLSNSISDSHLLTVKSDPVEAKIILHSRWLKKSSTGNAIIADTDSRKIHLVPPARKNPGETTINNYRVGYYPRPETKLCWYKNNLIITKNSAPYFAGPETENVRGKIQHGRRVQPISTGADTLVLINKRIKAKLKGEIVWIPEKSFVNPHSVRLFPHIYKQPRWFYPVTKENKQGYVLPGIKWNEFDHDQYVRNKIDHPYPHYIPLKLPLLSELTRLQKKLEKQGYSNRIKLISGSRNPFYNQAETKETNSLKAIYSRHQYGDAVDFIVDGTMNKKMDDINEDGEITIKDAQIIAELAKKLRKELGIKGGVGTYSQNDVKSRTQTPYVHLDQRGLNAEWSKKNK